jgi:hypothetical protein
MTVANSVYANISIDIYLVGLEVDGAVNMKSNFWIHDTIWSGRNLRTFRRNVLSSFSELKCKPSGQPAKASNTFLFGCSFDLFFEPEDEGDIFLRNLSVLLQDYTPLHPRR